jgi:hypothetical protein
MAEQGLMVTPKGDIDIATIEEAVARQVAEVQAGMAIAKKFPRNIKKVQEQVEMTCARPGLAEVALYEYARGGTAITGPSIRLAEAIAQVYGNIDFGMTEMDQRNGMSTIMTHAWDLETNVRQTKTFQVAHKRHTKKGTYKLEDPRDIYEMVANQGARRLRACILGVIPGDIVELAVNQCEETLRLKADVTPERIQNLLDMFSAYGVTKQQIETRIQRHIETISPGQMVLLGKIYNSLKDGMSVPSEWFEFEETPTGSAGLKEKLRGADEKSPESPEKGPKTPEPETGPETWAETPEPENGTETADPGPKPDPAVAEPQMDEVREYQIFSQFKNLKTPGFVEWLTKNYQNRPSWTLFISRAVDQKCKTLFGKALDEVLPELDSTKSSSSAASSEPTTPDTLEGKIARIEEILVEKYSDVAVVTQEEWMQASWDCDLTALRDRITDGIADAILNDLSDPIRSTLTSFAK